MTPSTLKYIPLLLFFITKTLQNTPLCNVCLCNVFGNNTPSSINCDGKVVEDIIYKPISNSSNLISTMSLQFDNLQKLQTFPSFKLRCLNLGHNSISVIGKGVFGNLQEMEELILAHNNIEVIDPDAFRGVYSETEFYPLKGLKILNVGYNKIHTLSGDLFEHIDGLETLVLGGNPLKSIDAQTVTAIASLVNLRSLDLSSTQLKDLPETFLYTPKLLKVLDLSGNSFEYVPSTLGVSHALETLYFDNNPIYKLSVENGFPNVSTLSVLHLSNMSKLEEIGSNSLGALENLKELYLSNNIHLSSIHPDFLVNLAKSKNKVSALIKFIINGNNITHIGNNTVLNWNHLSELNLKENPWVCDCEAKWLIEELIPMRQQINDEEIKDVRCMYPVKVRNKLLYEISREENQIKCDKQSHATRIWLHIATISGIIVAVACSLFLIYLWRYRRYGETLFEIKYGQNVYTRL